MLIRQKRTPTQTVQLVLLCGSPQNRALTGNQMAKSTKFEKGKSGNPGGRPKLPEGVRELAQTKAPEAFMRICDLINDNDQRIALSACSVVLERAYGRPATERPTIALDMPEIKNTENLLQAMGKVLLAVGNGDIAPADAKEVASLIEIQRKVIETSELEQRIAALEERPK